MMYPKIARGIRKRDGTGRRVEGIQHPDGRVEAVRWSICEAELVQAIGRGRGVNRSAENPLQIDIVTNVCLPIEVDETTTWGAIQPSPWEVMGARAAIPLGHADQAACYPDLFGSAKAAEHAAAARAGKPP
jgi:putative DNA primase/helicase